MHADSLFLEFESRVGDYFMKIVCLDSVAALLVVRLATVKTFEELARWFIAVEDRKRGFRL